MGAEVLIALQVAKGIQGFVQNNAAAKDISRATNANILNAQNQLEVNKQKQDRINRQAQGERTVKAAASGATLDSFDSVMDDSYNQGLMDIALLEYDSKLQQEQLRYDGAVKKTEYKNAAKSSLLEGMTSAGTTAYGKTSSPSSPTTTLKSGEKIYWNN